MRQRRLCNRTFSANQHHEKRKMSSRAVFPTIAEPRNVAHRARRAFARARPPHLVAGRARDAVDAVAMQCLSSPNMVRAPRNRARARFGISPPKTSSHRRPASRPDRESRAPDPSSLRASTAGGSATTHRDGTRRRRWDFPTTSCTAGSGCTGVCTVGTGTSSRTSARCTISSPRGGSTRSSPSAPAETGT